MSVWCPENFFVCRVGIGMASASALALSLGTLFSVGIGMVNLHVAEAGISHDHCHTSRLVRSDAGVCRILWVGWRGCWWVGGRNEFFNCLSPRKDGR